MIVKTKVGKVTIMQKSQEREIKVKSLQKALEILNCFTKKSSWGVTELSEYLNLNKSNVHNILTTFKSMEYLDQDEETGKYKLGMAIYTLSRALGKNLEIGSIALPYMQELADKSGERVYLAIPHGDEVIYVTSTYPQEAVYLMRTIMGERAKMYCTGLGKAMLAYLPKDQVDEYLSRPLERHTEYTLTDPEALRAELEGIRRRGYSVDNMEHEFGIKCVAVPIFNRQHEVEGAISITGPSRRFGEDMIPELAEEIRKRVAKIESRL